MIEATEDVTGTIGTRKVVEAGEDGGHLAAGISPSDLAVESRECGQYLLINCGNELVAMYGAMDGSVAAVGFADGGCYSLEKRLDVIAEDCGGMGMTKKSGMGRSEQGALLDGEDAPGRKSRRWRYGEQRQHTDICARPGVRRANATRGRPAGKIRAADGIEEQTGFGF